MLIITNNRGVASLAATYTIIMFFPSVYFLLDRAQQQLFEHNTV